MAGSASEGREPNMFSSFSSRSDCNGATCNTTGSLGDDYYLGIDWTVMAPAMAAYALIFLLGLTGNSMVIFAIHCCRRLHTATSLLLANLAVADLLLLILLIPVKVVVEVLDDWPLGEVVCRTMAYINVVSPTCSVFTMSVIALERCYVVLFPLEAKSVITMGRTRIAVIAIWTLSLATCIPALFSKTTVHMYGGGDEWTTCSDGWPSKTIGLVYAVYVMLILFGIPVLILTVCYSLVIVRLRSSKRLTKHMRPLSSANIPMHRFQDDDGATAVTRGETGHCLASDGDDATREGDGLGSSCGVQGKRVGYNCLVDSTKRPQRKQRTEAEKLQRIVAMLILVVVIFLICWGPLFTFSILLKSGLAGDNYTEDDVWMISLVMHLIAYGNSCVNPFIYAFMSESFREGFAMTLRGCTGGRRQVQNRRISQQSSFWSGNTTRNMSVSSANPCRV